MTMDHDKIKGKCPEYCNDMDAMNDPKSDKDWSKCAPCGDRGNSHDGNWSDPMHHEDSMMDGIDLMFGNNAAMGREAGGLVLTAVAVAAASAIF